MNNRRPRKGRLLGGRGRERRFKLFGDSGNPSGQRLAEVEQPVLPTALCILAAEVQS